MDWYYAVDREKQGPFSETVFKSLVEEGTVTPETLVWNGTLTDWKPFGEVDFMAGPARDAAVRTGDHDTDRVACTECGNFFPQDDLVSYNASRVCAACKPAFLQKIREGVSTSAVIYGGFWLRFGAKIIDYILITVVNYILAIPIGAFLMPEAGGANLSDPGAFKAIMIPSMLMGLLQWAVYIFYSTWFVGKFAATPGKMACGLKIVTAGNQRVSYLRAFGRYFAEMISGIILLIGYIMAAFDAEKRTLHDRICATRVIRKQR